MYNRFCIVFVGKKPAGLHHTGTFTNYCQLPPSALGPWALLPGAAGVSRASGPAAHGFISQVPVYWEAIFSSAYWPLCFLRIARKSPQGRWAKVIFL